MITLSALMPFRLTPASKPLKELILYMMQLPGTRTEPDSLVAVRYEFQSCDVGYIYLSDERYSDYHQRWEHISGLFLHIRGYLPGQNCSWMSFQTHSEPFKSSR